MTDFRTRSQIAGCHDRQETVKAPAVTRLLQWASWLSLAAAAPVAATALLSRWAVNAESLGAHDMGLALSFSVTGALALIGLTYAAPVLALVGCLSLYFHRDAGLRFLAAGVIASIPIAVLTWLERT